MMTFEWPAPTTAQAAAATAAADAAAAAAAAPAAAVAAAAATAVCSRRRRSRSRSSRRVRQRSLSGLQLFAKRFMHAFNLLGYQYGIIGFEMLRVPSEVLPMLKLPKSRFAEKNECQENR
jgi:hypothetical protein